MKAIVILMVLTTQVGFTQYLVSPFKVDDYHQIDSFNFTNQKNSNNDIRLNVLGYSTAKEKKKVELAVLYSLLVPGMGELYAENYQTGKYFTIAEGALWITVGSFLLNGSWLRDDARRFALQHAQLNGLENDDQYFIDVGNFRNVYTFNEQVLRDRDPHKIYDPTLHYWNWDDDVNRENYRDIRIAGEKAFNNAQFVIAAIAINHVASAINAARLTYSYNENAEQADSFSIHASVMGGIFSPHGIRLSLAKKF